MRNWGMQQHCTLCGKPEETRDHLFFACLFSYTVWDNVAGRLLGRRTNPDSFSATRLGVGKNGLSDDHIQCREGMEWEKAPSALFYSSAGQQVTRLIDKTMRNRISSLKYGRKHKLEGLLHRWFEVAP